MCYRDYENLVKSFVSNGLFIIIILTYGYYLIPRYILLEEKQDENSIHT